MCSGSRCSGSRAGAAPAADGQQARRGARRAGAPGLRRTGAVAALLVALGVGLTCGVAHAAEWNADDLTAITRQLQAILAAPPPEVAAIGQRAASAAAAAALPGAGAGLARGVLDSSGGAPQVAGETTAPEHRPLLLLVSASLGEQGLLEALRTAAADGHTRVLLQGVLPGEKLGPGIRRLAGLAASVAGGPGFEIDPPSFRAFRVTVVPTIVDPLTGATWRGSYALASFRDALATAERPFDAARGPARAISEPDLAQVMQARAASLDAGQLTAAARQRFWQHVAFDDLPPAQRDRVRTVDPTLWTAAPVRDQGGAVMVPANTKLNPLAQVPWRHRLVAFDARDAGQVRWARLLAAGDGTAVFLATAMDRDTGWDGWAALGQRLGGRVFLLPAALAQRLGLEVVPSIVEQQGQVLRITEVDVARLRGGADETGQ